ncbi:hypothetical protein [Escherichia coli]|uniref:hypothetical protein n=1 Tax=Escherichia coli TaxID=562 RepID=UPI002157423E|nr:hypothetical protein [Escherichia coli]
MKTILKVSALALLISNVAVSYAADNAFVEITGNIVAHSCDLSADAPRWDLGNHQAGDFVDASTKVGAIPHILTINCSNSDTLASAGDPLNIEVRDETWGAGLSSQNDIDTTKYWGNSGGTGAGIVLNLETQSVPATMTEGTAKDVTPTDSEYAVATAKAAAANIDGIYTVKATPAMQAPVPASVKTGYVNANLMFTMAP